MLETLRSAFALLSPKKAAAAQRAQQGVATTAADPIDRFGKYPPDPDGFPLLSIDRLIEHQAELIAEIKRSTRWVTEEQWQDYFVHAIRAYAAYVHLLPASENDHHRGVGGLFRHGLEVAHKSMLIGYGFAQDLSNFPSTNRKLEERWSYACFIAGLCHDIGKAVMDMVVTDESGNNQWSPFVESLVDWAARVETPRYFITYRPNRHGHHAAFNVQASTFVMRKEAALYLSRINNQLMKDVTDAIMCSPTSIANLVDYVRRADAESCDEDRKRNPLSDAGSGSFTSVTPAYKYLLDGVRLCIRQNVWTPNTIGSPLWIINRGLYLVWPRACSDILKHLPSTKGMPTDPETLAELLEERKIITPYKDSREQLTRYWSILPKPLQAKGVEQPLKAICFESAKLFYEVEPVSVEASIFSPIEVAKLLKAKGAHPDVHAESVLPEQSPEAEKREPEKKAGRQASTPEPAPAPGKAAAAPAPSRTEAEPSLDDVNALLADAREESGVMGGFEDIESMLLGAAKLERPSDPVPQIKHVEPGKRADDRQAPPPGAGVDRMRSQPLTKGASSDAQNARRWLQDRDPALGAVLIDLMDRLAMPGKNPVSGLVATKGELLVVAYPEGLGDIGMEHREFLKSAKDREWLDATLPGGSIKTDLGYKRSVVLAREVSAKLRRILGDTPLPDVSQVDPSVQKEARKEAPKTSDLQSYREAQTTDVPAPVQIGPAAVPQPAAGTKPPPVMPPEPLVIRTHDPVPPPERIRVEFDPPGQGQTQKGGGRQPPTQQAKKPVPAPEPVNPAAPPRKEPELPAAPAPEMLNSAQILAQGRRPQQRPGPESAPTAQPKAAEPPIDPSERANRARDALLPALREMYAAMPEVFEPSPKEGNMRVVYSVLNRGLKERLPESLRSALNAALAAHRDTIVMVDVPGSPTVMDIPRNYLES